MLHLNRIKSLLDFLRIGEPSLNSILQFVALDTLYEFGAITLFLNIVRRDGSVHIPAWYGQEESNVLLIPERLVSADTPVNRSLRTGVVTDCGDFDGYLYAGTGYQEKLFPNGFASSFAWPIPGVGSVVTMCSKKVELTVTEQEFLLVIGEVIAIELTRVRANVELGKSTSVKDGASSIALTPRQWTILSAIEKGRTNGEIAGDLGFSESLVRQETVQIYKKLGVSGRREIQEAGQGFSQTNAPSDSDPQI